MVEKIFMTEAEKREAQLDAKLEMLAAKGDWDGILAELDLFDENNERRHELHRDYLDITLLERQANDDDYYCKDKLLRLSLSRTEDWNEIIFSRNPEDLHQLVEEYPVSEALRELTPIQKKVLLLNIVHGIPAKDLAEDIDCSTRNITKHRQKALETIRFLVAGEKSVRTALQS